MTRTEVAGNTVNPRVVAERLYAVIEKALSSGLTSFSVFFDEYSRFVWNLRSSEDDLAISNRTWRGFTGGSTTRAGDNRSMFILYRNVLLATGVLEELRPPDKEARLSGAWKSLLPVPGGPGGPDEAWRIVAGMLSNRAPDPFSVDEVRRHLSRCRPHMPPGGGVAAELDMSPRNRFRVEQIRVALLISAKMLNPDHTLVSMWPDIDNVDSADLALFPPGRRKPSALIKCGLGNATDDRADAFLDFVVSGKHGGAQLVFLSVYDPDPELRRRCEAAGVEVVSVLLRRAPGDTPAAAEAQVAEDAFDGQSNP